MSLRSRYDKAYKRAKALDMERQLVELVECAITSYGSARDQYDSIRWGQEPDALIASEAPAVQAGEVLPVLGVLEQVEYSGTKAGEYFLWYHQFDPDKPYLCVNREGKLVIVGGSYVVTERGIVG